MNRLQERVPRVCTAGTVECVCVCVLCIYLERCQGLFKGSLIKSSERTLVLSLIGASWELAVIKPFSFCPFLRVNTND